MDYFYSQQIRQYRLQVIRAFSNFSVSFGVNPDGSPILHRVPCRYGDSSRMAATIITGGSENKMPTTPFISVYVTGMAMAANRRAAPSLVSPVNVTERAYDSETGAYLETAGNAYSVERYMPVPYDLTFNVDIWTSNLDQKESLIEQILPLYNSMVDIQTSNNGLDWSNLSVIETTDLTWSSRSIPVGTENPIDVLTMTIKVPIWISPPAKVQYQKIIQEIVANIQDGRYDPDSMEWTDLDLLSRRFTTPDNARIGVNFVSENSYELSLQTSGGATKDSENLPTRIQGSSPPILVPNSKFSINGIDITVPNGTIDDLIREIRSQVPDSQINAGITLSGHLEIYNNSGGNIELVNIQGTPVNQLGFLPTVYKGGTLAWWRLLSLYGTLQNYSAQSSGASQISLVSQLDLDTRTNDVRGWLQVHPTNQNLLQWIPDSTTWPSTTLDPITAVIDPTKSRPGTGIASPVTNQRYLMVNDMPLSSAAWGNVSALPAQSGKIQSIDPIHPNVLTLTDVEGTISLGRASYLSLGDNSHSVQIRQVTSISLNTWIVVLTQAFVGEVNDGVQIQYPVVANDIIQYVGSGWILAWDSTSSQNAEYVKNSFNNKTLSWTGNGWSVFPQNSYLPGYWRLSL